MKNKLLVLLIVIGILISGCIKGKFVSFNNLISNPQNYNGKNICTKGTYVSAFETSSLGESTYQKGDVTYLSEPVIWIEKAILNLRRIVSRKIWLNSVKLRSVVFLNLEENMVI